MVREKVSSNSQRERVLHDAILKIVNASDISLDVSNIAKAVKAAWGTTRMRLLELVNDNKIDCEKTSRGLLFKRKVDK